MTDRSLAIASLAALPGATPHRLGRLLAVDEPETAWQRVISGRVGSEVAPASVLNDWATSSRIARQSELSTTINEFGIAVSCWHDDSHPTTLTADIDPAPVLFRIGQLPDNLLPRVAIIGTRRCSPLGREIAFELGRDLAELDVVVVSGLALGIDGAAHRGALSVEGAPPLAVAGSGPDVVYPRRHFDLWQAVARRGMLCTEAPIGARPEPWRFPARNRLLAAMADLVVVVESRHAGGSLLTVEQAIRRDIPVMAVPGSLRNKAADGANQLLSDGCQPVRDVDDIVVALGLCEATTAARHRGDAREDPNVIELLDCVDDGPTTLDEIVSRSNMSVPSVLASLDSLVASGSIKRDGVRFTRAEGAIAQLSDRASPAGR